MFSRYCYQPYELGKIFLFRMPRLDCETCMKLWAEYGRAQRELRDPHPPTSRTPEAILHEIKIHEAKAHAKGKLISSTADQEDE